MNCLAVKKSFVPYLLFAGLLIGLPLCAGKKKVVSPTTTGSDDTVDISATIFLTEEEVTQKLGIDPGKGIVLVQVRVAPKVDHPVRVTPDDFILLSHDDGERNKPFEPSEIAGNGALVVSQKSQGAGDGGGRTKPTFGGGFGGIGSGSGVGAGGGTTTTRIDSKMDSKSEGKAKLLEILKEKQFPDKESVDPVEGYLYFPLDGKHKLKNLAILYRGRTGKFDMEFEN